MIYSPGPVLIDIGHLFGWQKSLPIRWYGLTTGLGFLIGIFLILFQLKNKVNTEQKQNLLDLLFWGFLGGVIGARLWFVILNFNYFSQNLTEILAIWQGGQSIQGGLIGGFLSGCFYYKINSNKSGFLPLGQIIDLAGMALPFAQAIGRFGNFFNTEAFGKPTNLPWALYVPEANRPIQYIAAEGFHPTFFYEAIYLILIGFYLKAMYERKTTYSGNLFCLYLILYSIGRFFLEFMRLDSLKIGFFPAAQVLCLVFILIASFFYFYLPNYKLDKIKNP
jgi:phosphatidylglycerol---prolipoprotein diacylglyceryl transferase